jgi:hypothetical protein
MWLAQIVRVVLQPEFMQCGEFVAVSQTEVLWRFDPGFLVVGRACAEVEALEVLGLQEAVSEGLVFGAWGEAAVEVPVDCEFEGVEL